MVKTRSTSSMSISTEVQEYFADLVKPLATNLDMIKMSEKFKGEIVEKFELKLREQEKKICELESTLGLRQNIIDKLMIACDDNEQYSRRSCLRINGIETVKGKEYNSAVVNKLESCYKEVDINFDHHAIDRVHRIGKKFLDESGKETQQIIVKFRSWNDREKFYRARPKGLEKKPGFKVNVDLTKRRYNLLRTARGLIDSNGKAKYAFSDINCSLAIRMLDESLCYFNSEEELDKFLN